MRYRGTHISAADFDRTDDNISKDFLCVKLKKHFFNFNLTFDKIYIETLTFNSHLTKLRNLSV